MIPQNNAIEIKKRKLREELERENPNKHIVKRLEESIKRHEKEMALIKKIQRKRKHGIN